MAFWVVVMFYLPVFVLLAAGVFLWWRLTRLESEIAAIRRDIDFVCAELGRSNATVEVDLRISMIEQRLDAISWKLYQ